MCVFRGLWGQRLMIGLVSLSHPRPCMLRQSLLRNPELPVSQWVSVLWASLCLTPSARMTSGLQTPQVYKGTYYSLAPSSCPLRHLPSPTHSCFVFVSLKAGSHCVVQFGLGHLVFLPQLGSCTTVTTSLTLDCVPQPPP